MKLLNIPVLLAAVLITGKATALFQSGEWKDDNYCGENGNFICYNATGSTPQNITEHNILLIAAYLRSQAKQGNAWYNFTATDDDIGGCSEAAVAKTYGDVQISFKHIDYSKNSSVLYDDIAHTLDGGPRATADQRKNSLLGCGTNGGSMAVITNSSRIEYSAPEFTSGLKVNTGIEVKVFRCYLSTGVPCPA